MRALRTVLAALAALPLTACATAVLDRAERVELLSHPTGADVEVRDREGRVVFEGRTPTVADLERGVGWFEPAGYTATFELEGHARHDVDLEGGLNGWYLCGNLLFGGLVGHLIVDPLTGAMWTLAREPVEVSLTPEATP